MAFQENETITDEKKESNLASVSDIGTTQGFIVYIF